MKKIRCAAVALQGIALTFSVCLKAATATAFSDAAFGIDTSMMSADGFATRPYPVTELREPCTHFDRKRSPFFGDTHVHTAYSFDANSQDTRNTPFDAYRFARGGRMGIQPYGDDGQPMRSIQLDRPLDFAAVTDHAEFFGEIDICTTPGRDGYWHPVCMLHRYVPKTTMLTLAAKGMVAKERWGFCGDNNEHCLAQQHMIWQQVQDAAEQAYDRSSDCRFTSFVGYEWTASVGAGKNLHHNVIFKNNDVPERPLSWIETPTIVDLWNYIEDECIAELDDCDAVTIPHNSNLSGGLMFETARVEDDAIPEGAVTAEEARQRQRFTRLFELVQHKGESECDNRLGWTEDEFCGFEKLPYDSFGGKNTGDSGGTLFKLADFFIDESDLPATQLPEPSNYLRYALKKGLQQRAELGVNSFKYGLIGSTDTHIAAPGMTAEKNHPAHGGAGMGARGELPKGLPDEIEFGPGGLAVLWAEENTRDSLYAAMQRREAYATSGTRPTLRFFGGWDYAANLCDRPDLVEQGYAGGVPMGGDMPARPGDANPTFAVLAMQDPGSDSIEGIPLQRAQIIKGWYQNGELHEQVLDVAGGANDATVDTTTCERSGVGHRSLCTVWEDKNFRADAQAFYYVRVLENPSCRWSQYYCNDAGVQCDDPATISEGMEGCCAAEHQPVIQERAWSSPIWYTPAG